jgi:hypothetical protein
MHHIPLFMNVSTFYCKLIGLKKVQTVALEFIG